MITDQVEMIIEDDGLDDGIIIVNHDLGTATINTRQQQVVGLCRGQRGFREQMNILSLLQERRPKA